jgi:alkylation response protein AidB-like acyl-CoA dehydrogenase
MDSYVAPLADITSALLAVGLGELLQFPAFDGIDVATVTELLEGFGRLAGEVIAPTDRIGDRAGATLDTATGEVTVADQVAAAFAAFTEGGWTALSAPTEFGGGGFPSLVAAANSEMFCSANMALSLNPVLTQSAIELLERWADDRQRGLFLSRLIDGTWTGTMNLTEPDAGSDLGAVRTTATPLGDNPATATRFAINGTKIFITWGEHSLTDNILHLVLARLPGAPDGTRGISLFLVPKFTVDDSGAILERNGVRCLALEHKLGIHSSPTCVLQFENAVGELVGPVNGGMAAMFSMMNPARLSIGVQGVAIGERALQQASSFADERRQGRSKSNVTAEPSRIAEHPDVKRMLLDMAVTVDAARLLVYSAFAAADTAKHAPDADQREHAQRRADLLTPLAKAWPTDEAVRVASLAVQVHGGMGFIEETGIAQRYRDARIAPIYEGTNGIQAIDLAGRKIARDDGRAAAELLGEIAEIADRAVGVAELSASAKALSDAVQQSRAGVAWIVERFATDTDNVLAGATAVLELLALTVAASLLIRQAIEHAANQLPDAGRRLARAEFFALDRLSRLPSLTAISLGVDLLDAGLAVWPV